MRVLPAGGGIGASKDPGQPQYITCWRAMRLYPIAPTPPTPPTPQYQAGLCVNEPWCTSAPATVALPSMLAAMQWVGILESGAWSWVATTDAPITTAPAAQQCVGIDIKL